MKAVGDISLANVYVSPSYYVRGRIMKYIPNIITCIRILISVVLLLFKPLSITFIIFYYLGGATDILDGYIARRIKCVSKTGATLDSIADLIFIGAVLYIFIPILLITSWEMIWIVVIAIIRILSIIIGYIRYRAFASLHTLSNKFTGLILFFFPLIYQVWGMNQSIIIMLIIASLSAVEEIAINLTSDSLNLDVMGLFLK